MKGKAETATAAEILNDTQTAALFISPQYLNDALAFFGLTETAGAIPIDLDDGLNFSVTIDENSALGNPSNEDGRQGRSGVIKVTASGANRTIDLGSEWLADVGFTWPLTVNSGATTYFGYVVSATGVFTIIGIAQNVAGT